MKNLMSQFFSDEGGATAIEYSLTAALLSVVILFSITFVGTSLTQTFNVISNKLRNSMSVDSLIDSETPKGRGAVNRPDSALPIRGGDGKGRP